MTEQPKSPSVTMVQCQACRLGLSPEQCECPVDRPYRPEDGEWFCTGCSRPRTLMPGEEPCCGLGSTRVTPRPQDGGSAFECGCGNPEAHAATQQEVRIVPTAQNGQSDTTTESAT